MMHTDRAWCVSEVSSAEELAEKLSSLTWCNCSAFQVAGHPRYYWLNDSTSPDAAQEYAVCRHDDVTDSILQIESITFSWCDLVKSLMVIQNTLDGHDDHTLGTPVTPTLEPPINTTAAPTAPDPIRPTPCIHRCRDF
ncbi:MAG: hypothetical protein R3C01_01985 [Planctomycetaceae bacterium]